MAVSRRRWLIASLVVGITVLAAGGARAVTCTYGTNCFCDCVKGPDSGNGFKNAACQARGTYVSTSAANPAGAAPLLACEDFEAPTLVSNVNAGVTSDPYGPPWDGTGWGGPGNNRGFNSYWSRKYGSPTFCGAWNPNQPSSPLLGLACSAGGLCGNAFWSPTDQWNGNTQANCGGANLAILQGGQFNAEVASITTPTGGSSTGGIYDGSAVLGHRVQPNNHGDLHGGPSWSAARNFGITMAYAFPSNIDSSGLLRAQWKFNEWPPGGGGSGDGIFLFWSSTGGLSDTFPFMHFQFGTDPSTGAQIQTPAQCAARAAAATKTVGTLDCTDFSGGPNTEHFHHRASTANYRFTRDWGLGVWGCVEGQFDNIGLSNSRVRIWLTTPTVTRQPIIDISNWDMTGTFWGRNGYSGYSWNEYSNTNDPQLGGPPSSQTSFRYEDNVYIRAGAPVGCPQISGVGGGGPSNTSIQPTTATTTITSTVAIARIVGTILSPKGAIRNVLADAWTGMLLIVAVIVIAVTIRSLRKVRR